MLTGPSHVIETARREMGGALPENPVRLVRKRGADLPRDRWLVNDEQERVLAAVQTTDHRSPSGRLAAGVARNTFLGPIIRLVLETAMRQGELDGLRWERIGFARNLAMLPVTKNGRKRFVALSSVAVGMLRAQSPPPSGPVFPGLRPESIKRAFARARKQAGIEGLRFHDLRQHKVTSRRFERGLNVFEVASVTRHQTLQHLMRYTHPYAEEIARKPGWPRFPQAVCSRK